MRLLAEAVRHSRLGGQNKHRNPLLRSLMANYVCGYYRKSSLTVFNELVRPLTFGVQSR